MKKPLIKVIGVTFVIALMLNVIVIQRTHTEDPPMHGTNTITQVHIS